MDPLTELVDLIAEQKDPLGSFQPVLDYCPTFKSDPSEHAANGRVSYQPGQVLARAVSKQELGGILALARFLARSQGKEQSTLLPRLLKYVQALGFAAQQDADPLLQLQAVASPFFEELFKYLHELDGACPEVRAPISSTILYVLQMFVKENQLHERCIAGRLAPVGVQAFLAGMNRITVPMCSGDAQAVTELLYQYWIDPSRSVKVNGASTPAANHEKSEDPKENTPLDTLSAPELANGKASPDAVKGKVQVGNLEYVARGLDGDVYQANKTVESPSNGTAGFPSLGEVESTASSTDLLTLDGHTDLRSIEARQVSFRLVAQLVLDTKLESRPLSQQQLPLRSQYWAASRHQLQAILQLLKGVSTEGSTEAELPSRREADTNFGAAVAAAELCVSLTILAGEEGAPDTPGRGAVGLLYDIADACVASKWRTYPACEALFKKVLQGIVDVAIAHQGALTREVLLRLKPLLFATAAIRTKRASALEWAGEIVDGIESLGPMAEAVAAAAVRMLREEWDREQGACVSFLMALPAVIRDQAIEDEPRARALGHGVITLLADILAQLEAQSAVDLVLPLYIESLEEGAASTSTSTRVRFVAAAAKLAGLGYLNPYREVVVLLTRLYLDQMQAGSVSDGSAVEREESLPNAFLHIATELKEPELRSDYRFRLLALCSDVGLLIEARSGSSGTAHLGSLLLAVAAACRDHMPLKAVEPSLHKLFRNLWFYIALFGLAPPLATAAAPPGGRNTGRAPASSSALSLEAVRGPYRWRPEWAAAVATIAEATPPLVLAGIKWLEDELELNALLNPGSRRGTANEKAAALQRAALATALAGKVDNLSLQSISGVKATYLLAVTWLEILRLSGPGGTRQLPLSRPRGGVNGLRSSLWCTFQYLETASLSPEVHRCLDAVARCAFAAALERLSNTPPDKEAARDAELEAHTALLLSLLTHRDPAVVELADSLVANLRNTFKQVLWSGHNIDVLLQLVVEPNLLQNGIDPTAIHAQREALHQRVQEWLTCSLLLAPATTQGLLQEKMRGLSEQGLGRGTGDLLSLLSEVHLSQVPPPAISNRGGLPMPGSVPATKVAAGAAAGGAPVGEVGRHMDNLFKGMLSAMTKAQYVGEVGGMLRFQPTSLPLEGTSLLLNQEGTLSREGDAYDSLVGQFSAQLQALASENPDGSSQQAAAFRVACLRGAALLLVGKEEHASSRPSQKSLLRLLCWCPAQLFTESALEAGVFVWTWLLAAAPDLGLDLLSELGGAWEWTKAAEKGIFATASACQGERALLRPQLTPGEPEPAPEKDPMQGIAAHRIWLGFLLDRFEVARHSSLEQLGLLGCFLGSSLADPNALTHHPAAGGTVFSLLLLGLRFVRHHAAVQTITPAVALLQQRVYRCAFAWFAVPPAWYEAPDQDIERSEAVVVEAFLKYVEKEDPLGLPQGQGFLAASGLHPVWGSNNVTMNAMARHQLLQLLCEQEVDRLETWAVPLATDAFVRVKTTLIPDHRWIELTQTAWGVDPRIGIVMVSRWPGVTAVRSAVTSLVNAHAASLCDFPEALPFFVTPAAAAADSPVLHCLSYYAPCSITQALEFLMPPFKGHARVMAYVLRVLQSYPPTKVTFFMPQLVQALRYDHGGLVEGYLLHAAQQNNIFAHRLIWQLQGEEAPPEGELVPGRQPLLRNELWDIVPRVRQRVIAGFAPQARAVFEREFRLFDGVTSISGKLKPLPKEERRAAIKPALEGIQVEGLECYLPTAPSKLVRGIRRESGVPLQSAAKAPFLLAFDVVDANDPTAPPTIQGCIFKEGDDCRQDVLALQVIALLRDIFSAVNLDLYLFPYGVLPTGYERGIIEMVPNTRSRNQMGEITDFGLYEMFQQEYGPVGSPAFERARNNFIVSSAGYAVASLLLQPKDRHNGNLLFDNQGRLVHIDFGFILGISPGGNLGFESAAFKLSHEMTQLLDPSGIQKSEPWYRFKSLCVKGYLAARHHMQGIVSTVELMADSGLPCFALGRTMDNLKRRFNPQMNEREAANFMLLTCDDAYNKWTTAGYDVIQYLQQDIQH